MSWSEHYLCLAPSELNPASGTEDRAGQCSCVDGSTTLDSSDLVPQINQIISSESNPSPSRPISIIPTLPTREISPIGERPNSNGMSLIRASLTTRGISVQAQEIIIHGWRKGTQKQYEVYLQK